MGGQRLSANLPVAWLTDPTIRGLSPVALALHVMSITWSMAHETDGRIDVGTLTVVRPPRTSAKVIDRGLEELVSCGLWARREGGFVIKKWSATQTTSAQMEANRARWRNSKRGGKNLEVAGDQRPGADSLADAVPLRNGLHGGTPAELSYPEGTGREGAGREGTGRGGVPLSEYDEAFATDPGDVLEADLWEIDPIDGSRHHSLTGEVVDD